MSRRTPLPAVAALLVAHTAFAQFTGGPPRKLTLSLPEALHFTIDAYGGFLQSESIVLNVLASQVSTFPTGSSSGAFTFTYDERTRTFTRRSPGLGPRYAERATTLGRRNAFELGSAVQFARYRSLGDRDLAHGVLYSFSRSLDGAVQSGTQLDMSLSQRILSLYASYGASESVDFRVIVPIVTTTYHGVVRDGNGNIRAGTFPRTSRPGAFDFAGFTTAIADFGPVTSTGFGDVQAQAKWNFLRSPAIDAAGKVELRIPTGDYYALTGTDAWRQQMSALVTVHSGKFEEHVNIGYRFRLSGATLLESASNTLREQQGATTNELDYNAGAEWAPTPRISVTAEFVGRYSRDSIVFRPSVEERADDDFVGDSIRGRVANEHQLMGALGAKYVLHGNTILSGHVLFSLNRAGLTIRPTPVIGIEHAF